MKIREIVFNHQGENMDSVNVVVGDMIDTPTHEFGRGELRMEFLLPITPEIGQWIESTLTALGTEIRKHTGVPLE